MINIQKSISTHQPASPLILISAMAVLQITASLCYPIVKAGLEQIEPFTFAFYRYLVASIVLLSILKTRGGNNKPIVKADWYWITLLGFLIIPLNQTLFLFGQSMTAAGHGAFMFATTPIWVFLLAIIHLKETVTLRKTVGFAVAAAGVLTIMLSGQIEVGRDYLIGDMIILVSVAAWGYYTILGKRLVIEYGALRVTAYALGIGSIMYFPFGLYRAMTFDYSGVTLFAWGSILYMAIGLSGVVYVLWYWLLKYMEASRLAVYHNVQPVIATTLGVIFLGEPFGWPLMVGGIAVIAGVLIAEIRGTNLVRPPLAEQSD